MIVLTFRKKHNVPEFARDAVTGYRWALELSGLSIGFYHQYQAAIGGAWRHGGRYYNTSITSYHAWGRSHSYYNGPHDCLSLGFLHLNWSGDWCDRCYQDA